MTEFRTLRMGGARPFMLGLAASVLIAALGLGYALWR